ncbi:TauD/TfdA dioxygenase family protein [Sphingomonas solaris]|uniref:TauD/TfdA family dioxygenase n=1 Tax=Alterirhizorhabdus solaris TaxID=2529389 RepID=A0A558QRM6_9SPHN|nr:TauD/TfdA family dioxygenase [Sphingomonas solaris]TVV69788.1 TauD/TfdA family dioxygenase [Sphingomonas solaris]
MLDTIAATLPFTVAPLDAAVPFGARVEGLTHADLDRAEVRQALFDLWIDRGVILFRGAQDSAFHVALSEVFGPLERHAFREAWVDGHPELVNIKYYPDDGTVYTVDGRPRGGFLPWHSDLIYTDRINRGGILRPVRLPARGGMTGFIDQIAAYDTLPDGLKERIEGLHVVYQMDLNAAHMRFGARQSLRLERFARSGAKIALREWHYPRVLHPMVFRQPETRRAVLNVSPWFAVGIYELGGLEGERLLAEVVDHCLDATPAYHHAWQEGDMVLWDNWRTLHSASGVAPEETRVMQRTTIAGDYALGRTLDGGGAGLPRVDV